jgi:Spy/CpxP family protein refolding chaperone
MGRRGFRDAEGGRIFELLQRPDVQKELGITDEQRNKLDDIAFNARKAAIQARSNLEVHRLELGRLMRADNPDRSAIDKKLQEVAQAEAALRRSMINSFLDARNVLTKEQRDKVREGMQKRMQERMQRMQQRGPGSGRWEPRARRRPAVEGREGIAPPPPPPPRPPIQ